MGLKVSDAQIVDALVIGAGPAGLMAAEELLRAGRKVVICEAKPSPARKFLMAGKSGLNVTKDETIDDFAAAYDCPDWLLPMLRDFGPREVIAWCRGLGQDVFTGTTGRVFPKTMKGSPLLRAWLARLGAAGAELRTGWRWTGFDGAHMTFATAKGPQTIAANVTVLALGGASWARLGSDGAWAEILAERGVPLTPFGPANMGFQVAWSTHMAKHFGAPIKGAVLRAGDQQARGEFVITAAGLEGGGIYTVSRALRMGAPLVLDLMPDVPTQELQAKLDAQRPGESTVNRLRKLGLGAATIALIMEFGRGQPLAKAVKSLEVPLLGPNPLDQAISVAGGIARVGLTDGLELKTLPGVFACGEMLDWEAPTGGYLLTAAWSTGRWAGRAAAQN